MKHLFLFLTLIHIIIIPGASQKINDATTPLHLMQPDYPMPYGKPDLDAIEQTLTRILNYLSSSTPIELINKDSKTTVKDFSKVDENTIMKPGDFRLNSYEWGVTYAGMLLAAENTGNPEFKKYTRSRVDFLGDILKAFEKFEEQNPKKSYQIYNSLHPHALDDCGAICAAMIKISKSDQNNNLDWIINTYADYITNDEFRLEDGTLARNRPHPNTLWLDDLFMSVPALAQMGSYTGETKYFDDAVKQVLQFSERMFNHDKGVFMHGWVQDMEDHPEFHWARANGWAIMAIVELLEVLPEAYNGRDEIVALVREHIRGLAKYQSGKGLWHQLLDRNDTYLETSSSAIFTYSIARAINRGYVDAKTYGPMVSLAWNAVSQMVNENGQVEGTCVGTGMGFEPAFYYHRPVNVYAAHGYGPVLLAGAEMIDLVKKFDIKINDSATLLYIEKSDKK